MIHCRTLAEGEQFPQHLNTGFEDMPVMNSFCWVAETGQRIVGALLAAPCHGLIFIVRLKIEEYAPAITASLLLRSLMRDSERMGFKGFFTFIDPSRETERVLLGICRKAGGKQLENLQVPLVGALNVAARY